MSQILRVKRGSLERLSNITGSLQKGEILFVSASSQINADNGSSITFVTIESGSIQAVNRVMKGDVAPELTASQYIGLIDGIPFYESGSNSLVLLNSSGNEVINLEGNISDFSASVATALANLSSSVQSTTGDFSSSVATSFSASAFTITQLSTSVDSRIDALEQFSTSLDSTFATDIELAAVSASLSASQTFISESISTSLAGALNNIEIYFPQGVISSSQQVIDIFNANFSASMASTVDATFATDYEVEVTSSTMDAGEF